MFRWATSFEVHSLLTFLYTQGSGSILFYFVKICDINYANLWQYPPKIPDSTQLFEEDTKIVLYNKNCPERWTTWECKGGALCLTFDPKQRQLLLLVATTRSPTYVKSPFYPLTKSNKHILLPFIILLPITKFFTCLFQTCILTIHWLLMLRRPR